MVAGQSRAKALLFTAITVLLVAVLLYLGSVLVRSYSFYNFLKTGEHAWSEQVYAADGELGLAIQSNIVGYELLFGSRIPIRTGDYGVRVPEMGLQQYPRRPSILFLGDSFTFGAAEPAINTFAQRVAEALEVNVFNAGVPSYGLAHMRVRGEDLIRRIKPDIVVVQYSPWLAGRAVSPLGASYAGAVPAPFYIDSTFGPRLHQPLFSNLPIELPVMQFVDSDGGVMDFIRYLGQVGWPLYAHCDWQKTKIFFAQQSGALPPADQLQVIETVYRELTSIARDSGAVPIILALGSARDFALPQSAFPENVPVIDAHRYLLDQLPVPNLENYSRAYWHVEGNPPVNVDAHPNVLAHARIAEILVNALAIVKPELDKSANNPSDVQ